MIQCDNPLIHIGYHKTGTSWLQQHLFVRSSNSFYPLSMNDHGQSTLSRHFMIGEQGYLLSSFDNNVDTILDELRAIIARNGPIGQKIPVLSQERLSGNPHTGGFDARIIAGRLKCSFPQAKILIVIREQRQFIRSSYFEYLGRGGTDSLRKYLNTRYDGVLPFFTPHHCNYLPLVKEYMRLFGEASVAVMPYEMFKQHPADFFQGISDLVGMPLEVDSRLLSQRVNTMRGPFCRYYLRQLNRMRSRSSLNNYSLVANRYSNKGLLNLLAACDRLPLQRLDGRLIKQLDEYIERWVAGRYTAANRQLAELIGMDLTGYGYHLS